MGEEFLAVMATEFLIDSASIRNRPNSFNCNAKTFSNREKKGAFDSNMPTTRSRKKLKNRKGDAAPSLHEQLLFAITHKRLIGVIYDGAKRQGEPHDYGIQHGIPRLLFYQTERTDPNRGTTKVGGWRLLHVEKISDCIVTEKTFPGSRGDSHQQHLTWDKLFARVAPPDSDDPEKPKCKR